MIYKKVTMSTYQCSVFFNICDSNLKVIEKCYGLPVAFAKYGICNRMRAYICVRISVIKCASSGPPCCFWCGRLVLSIPDKKFLADKSAAYRLPLWALGYSVPFPPRHFWKFTRTAQGCRHNSPTKQSQSYMVMVLYTSHIR